MVLFRPYTEKYIIGIQRKKIAMVSREVPYIRNPALLFDVWKKLLCYYGAIMTGIL